MWLRISPEIDFYLDMELPGVNEKTREYDVQQYENVVYKEFVERLKKERLPATSAVPASPRLRTSRRRRGRLNSLSVSLVLSLI